MRTRIGCSPRPGVAVRELREEFDLTQVELAVELEMSQNRVSRIEQDEIGKAQVDTLRGYDEALGGTPATIRQSSQAEPGLAFEAMSREPWGIEQSHPSATHQPFTLAVFDYLGGPEPCYLELLPRFPRWPPL
jgi:transcriptional regulator with XRE-family HTH domain